MAGIPDKVILFANDIWYVGAVGPQDPSSTIFLHPTDSDGILNEPVARTTFPLYSEEGNLTEDRKGECFEVPGLQQGHGTRILAGQSASRLGEGKTPFFPFTETRGSTA